MKDELLEFLRQRLPGYMVPVAVVELAEFPLTPNNKIDTNALPAPDVTVQDVTGNPDDRARDEPQDDIEREIAQFWCKLFARERIGIHEHFFRLGGHSLQVMRVIAHVRKRFDVRVQARDLYEQPTIAALAKQVREAVHGH